METSPVHPVNLARAIQNATPAENGHTMAPAIMSAAAWLMFGAFVFFAVVLIHEWELTSELLQEVATPLWTMALGSFLSACATLVLFAVAAHWRDEEGRRRDSGQ